MGRPAASARRAPKNAMIFLLPSPRALINVFTIDFTFDFRSFFSMSVRHVHFFINGKTKIPPGGTPQCLAPAGGRFEVGSDGMFPRLRSGQAVGRGAAFHV